jgi:hypothetical protein
VPISFPTATKSPFCLQKKKKKKKKEIQLFGVFEFGYDVQ